MAAIYDGSKPRWKPTWTYADESIQHHVDVAECGFYRVRLVKNGPYVPARIWRSVATDPVTGETLDRSPILMGELAGEPVEPHALWRSCMGRAISEQEYQFLLDDYRWARAFAPDDPIANPKTPIAKKAALPAAPKIDLSASKPIF